MRHVRVWRFCLVCLVASLVTGLGSNPPWAQDGRDWLMATLRPQTPVLLCGETVPLEDPQALERFEKEMLLSVGNKPQVILWLKRTSRYFPTIEQMLREHGLPDDIKYLAIAESALRIHAGSIKGAMGVWQLMPQTARKYGLVVDDDIDERRNIYLSTPAALAYLRDLHALFGSWSLSLAAYNMGEEGLRAEMLEQETNDYYRLYLPQETQRFVFRILAIKLIVQAPGNYGINLSPEDLYVPERFTAIEVDAINELPLRLIAKAAETDFKTIKDLNPELRGHYLAAGTRLVSIPSECAAGFQERLTALVEADDQIRNQRIYVVKRGDSLSGIAQKFDIPIAALLIWNRIPNDMVIHPGQRLVIFPPDRGEGGGPKEGDGDIDG